MNIKIWSDVRCPFCYIGKHKLENAIEKFAHKDKLNISWHSFELNPHIKTEPEINAVDYLASAKGLSRKEIEKMMEGAINMGKKVGLILNLENSVVANSFNAHRLIQFAKTRGLDNEVEEALFKAHFEEGKNIDDKASLREIGESVGLKTVDLDQVLFTNAYEKEVRQDEETATRLGIRGVPFFIFNDKYALSGAQPEDVFLQTLEKAWEEFDKKDASFTVTEGQSCSTEGNCD